VANPDGKLTSVPFLRIAARFVLALCVCGVLPPSPALVLAPTASAAERGVASGRQAHTADAPAVPPRVLARVTSHPLATRKAPDAPAAVLALAPTAVPAGVFARHPASTPSVRSGTRFPHLVRGPPSLI
jgi:hypothetical protein